MPFGAEHLPADQVVSDAGRADRAERYAEGFVAEAMRWLDPEDDAAAHAPRARAASRPRVLVVDDNADMRAYIASLLAEPLRGARPRPTARSRWSSPARDPPELVLTDVMMPNLDGFGLLAGAAGRPGDDATSR